jgi:hypothetical protein
MNQARKQKVWDIEVALTKLMSTLKELYEAEYVAFGQLPIAIQESDAGKTNEQRYDDIEQLLLDVQDCALLAGKIINGAKGDVHEQHFTD